MINPVPADIAISPACAIVQAASETLLTVLNVLVTGLDALIQVTEFLTEIPFDGLPARDIGQKIHVSLTSIIVSRFCRWTQGPACRWLMP
jgi:hypothetical protein